jgi:hypothetical protein
LQQAEDFTSGAARIPRTNKVRLAWSKQRRELSVFKWFGTIWGVWNGGSGSFGFEIRRLSTDVAIVAV